MAVRERKLLTVAQIYRAICENKIVHAKYCATGVLAVVRDVLVCEDDILIEAKAPNYVTTFMYSSVKDTVEFYILLTDGDTF